MLQRLKARILKDRILVHKYSLLFTYGMAHSFLYFTRLFNLISDKEGDIVECGVGQGETLFQLCCLAKDEGRQRKVFGFDSFQGLPKPTIEDESERNFKQGDVCHSIKDVQFFLRQSGLEYYFVREQLTLIKGYFKDTLVHYNGKIALLHIDVDLYQSYNDVFACLYEKVIPGGVIMLGEYFNTDEFLKCPGAKKAIDEYLGVDKIKRDKISGRYYYIKGA